MISVNQYFVVMFQRYKEDNCRFQYCLLSMFYYSQIYLGPIAKVLINLANISKNCSLWNCNLKTKSLGLFRRNEIVFSDDIEIVFGTWNSSCTGRKNLSFWQKKRVWVSCGSTIFWVYFHKVVSKPMLPAQYPKLTVNWERKYSEANLQHLLYLSANFSFCSNQPERPRAEKLRQEFSFWDVYGLNWKKMGGEECEQVFLFPLLRTSTHRWRVMTVFSPPPSLLLFSLSIFNIIMTYIHFLPAVVLLV